MFTRAHTHDVINYYIILNYILYIDMKHILSKISKRLFIIDGVQYTLLDVLYTLIGILGILVLCVLADWIER